MSNNSRYNKNKRSNGNNSSRNNESRTRQNYRPNNGSTPEERTVKTFIEKKLDESLQLDGGQTLCSFVVLENSDSRLTLSVIGNILHSNSVHHIVISVHEKSLETLKTSILETFLAYKDMISFQHYSNTATMALHNRAFLVTKSDIFLITHSGYEPRPSSVEILKRYLYKQNNIAITPVVYTESGEIQKYCIKIPTLAIKIKALYSTQAKNSLTMTEKGESWYYKIHKTPATLAPFIVNSKVFNKVGGFKCVNAEQCSRAIFFKAIGEFGATVFTPNARFIEHNSQTYKGSLLAKFRYFITNVF